MTSVRGEECKLPKHAVTQFNPLLPRGEGQPAYPASEPARTWRSGLGESGGASLKEGPLHRPRTQDSPAGKRGCVRHRCAVLLCPVSGSALLHLRVLRGPLLLLLRCNACLQLGPQVFLLHRSFLHLQRLERLALSAQAFLQLICHALLLLDFLSCPGSLPLLLFDGSASLLLRCLALLLLCPMLFELGLALLLLSFCPACLLLLERGGVLRQLLFRRCPGGLGLAELLPQLPQSVVLPGALGAVGCSCCRGRTCCPCPDAFPGSKSFCWRRAAVSRSSAKLPGVLPGVLPE